MRAPRPDFVLLRRLSDHVPAVAVAVGIDDFSIEDIAEAADLETTDLPAAIDRHELVVDAFLRLLSDVHAVIAAGFDSVGTWSGGMEAGLRELLDDFSHRADEPRFLFVETPLSTDVRLRTLAEQARHGGARYLARMHRHLGGPDVRDVHFELLNGALIHRVADHLRHRSAATLPQLLDTLMALAVSPTRFEAPVPPPINDQQQPPH